MTNHLLVQISDVHLSGLGNLPMGADPRANLVAAFRVLDDSNVRPDVLLLTGDLADAGEASCYDDLSNITNQFVTTSGTSVVFLPGNHDDRATFRAHLLGESPLPTPINQIRWHEGLRIAAIDSTVPGEAFGALDDETLSFLAEELSRPARDGTVLAVHHPPIASPILPMSRLWLQNAGALREVIEGTDVRIILCGHNHHLASGMLGSIPVWVSPSTAYLADVRSTAVFQAIRGSAMTRLDLSDLDFTVTVIPIP